MNWNDIFMSALIATAISSAVVLISVVLTDLLSSKRVEQKLKDHDERLISAEKDLSNNVKDGDAGLNIFISDKHASLTKEHSKLSHEHDRIIRRLDEVHKLASDTYISYAKDEETQKNRYDNLNDTQRDIRKGILDVESLLKDWERIITENKELSQKNEVLNLKLNQLSEKINTLSVQNMDLANQVSMMQTRSNPVVPHVEREQKPPEDHYMSLGL